MLGQINIGGKFSEPFPVRNGVRQGCIAGPMLFNLFYAAMLNEATNDLQLHTFSDARQIIQSEQIACIDQRLRADTS